MSTKSIINWINKTFDFSNLLKSRTILYGFFILSIAQLYTYSVNNDYLYSVIFLLVGFLVSFFSKNMIVILCFALCCSYVLKYRESINDSYEGMTTSSDIEELTTGETMSSQPGVKEEITLLNDVDKTKDILSTDVDDEKKTDDKNKQKIKKTMKAVSPGMDKETQKEYKDLLELQLKLIDGISNMQPVLSEVAQKIDNMKKTMRSPV